MTSRHTNTIVEVGRSALIRLRRTRLARLVVRALIERAYRDGPIGRVTAAAARLAARYGVFESEDRTSSVEALVDMFFGLCRAIDVDLFVEAGAKEASASVRALDVLQADVVAFEANPFTHRRFADQHRNHRFEYVHAALVDQPGPRKFLVRLTDAGQPSADGQGSIHRRPDHGPGYRSESVPGITLDDHVATMESGRSAPYRRVALWADVEGALAEVFGGATSVMERADVVIAEVETRRTWDGQRFLDRDVINFLDGLGLVPVARDIQSRSQYNIVFVRQTSLREPVVAARVRREVGW